MYFGLELMLLRSEVVHVDNTSKYMEDKDVVVAHYVLIGVCTAYVPVILSFNFLVFWGIVLYPGFHNPNNYLLLNLAVADFLTGAYCLPMYILSYFPYTSQYIMGNKYACLTWFSSIELAGGGSLGSLLFITIDRYIAVILPLRYYQIVTVSRMIKAIIFLWAVCFVVAFGPMLFGWHQYDPMLFPLSARCNFHRTLSLWYVFTVTFGMTTSMLLICIILYVQIIYVSQRQIREFRKRIMTYNEMQVKYFENRIISVKISTCLMLLFILLWMPYMLILPFKYYNLISQNTIEILRVACLLLNFTNAIVNAPIYAMYRVEYKKVYVVMLSRKPCKWKRALRNLHRSINSFTMSEERRMSELMRCLSPDSDLSSSRMQSRDAPSQPDPQENVTRASVQTMSSVHSTNWQDENCSL